MSALQETAAGEPPRVAVVGMSLGASCGVRDHATLLAAALEAGGVPCSWHWLMRGASGLAGERAELGGFCDRLAAELERERPRAIVVHYSVFAYSFKGLPVLVPRVFSMLRERGVPIVAVLHEFAYPWFYGGWRGAIWAVSQRAVMARVIGSADAVLVTAHSRGEWLQTRPWLPRRPIAVAPVYSNLPPPAMIAERPEPPRVIGLFGYAYQGAAVELIVGALASLRAAGRDFELRLLGQPGADSEGGRAWARQAREAGIAELVTFTGTLPAQELSDQLAACDLLLFADLAGPSSRKGTLAGSLASGRPIVALDGPAAWPAFTAEQALRTVQPTEAALAAALEELLGDRAELEAQGRRGREFYEREMSIEHTARVTLELLSARG
ncbi:MAG TPA: glycosyltransferase [Solirubrobacteraceae bacterium]|nr:glycosyltransferase [Solirubrobacteraceae bacterium]